MGSHYTVVRQHKATPHYAYTLFDVVVSCCDCVGFYLYYLSELPRCKALMQTPSLYMQQGTIRQQMQLLSQQQKLHRLKKQVSTHSTSMAYEHPPTRVHLLDDTAKLWKSKCLVC